MRSWGCDQFGAVLVRFPRLWVASRQGTGALAANRSGSCRCSMLRSLPTMPAHRNRRRTMNRYVQMALDHNRRHRPDAYSQIPNPAEFFAGTGEEIAAQVSRLRDEILGSPRPDRKSIV